MDLRWLTAPEDAVAAAKADLKKDSQPRQMPRKRAVLVHVNHGLMLWYFAVVWITVGMRVDRFQEGSVQSQDIRDLAVTMGIFAIWVCGTYLLYRWAGVSALRRTRMRNRRQDLTALANGFEPESRGRVRFASLITGEPPKANASPRFLASGVEFGNLRAPRVNRLEWHYVKVSLPAPLPHFLLDATESDEHPRDLRVELHFDQRQSIGGAFDRRFALHVPAGYGPDAFLILSPDVMAALVDHASQYNVEIVGDTLIFFTSEIVDFTDPDTWRSIDALLSGVVPRLRRGAERYRDQRVPEQRTSPTVASIEAALQTPDSPWEQPEPRIGPVGKRLDMQDNRGAALLRDAGWCLGLVGFYLVPGLLAFAGVMSVIDGR